VNTAGSGTLAESPSCFFGAPDAGSHWYQFTPSVGGDLVFTVTPNGNANYDIAVFNVTFGCPGTEVRCNYDATSAAITGVGCVGPGCEPVYTVLAGNTYAILVSRFTSGSIGYTLDFTGTTAVFGGAPGPNFTFPDSLCAGQSVTFNNTTTTTNQNLGFHWNFGDNTTSTAISPTHTYTSAGTDTVTLVTSCGTGTSIAQKIIHILPGLAATVTPASTTFCNGDSVMLIGSAAYDTTIIVPLSFSNTTQYPIPDFPNPGIQSDIIVSGVQPNSFIANPLVSVCLNVTHTWTADLQLRLQAPDLSQMYLSFQSTFGPDFTGTCFTATATTPIAFGSAPYTGTWMPDDPFNLLNSSQINGTWSLLIDDYAFGDIGNLLDWSITFNTKNYLSYSWTPALGLTTTTNDTTTAMPVTTTAYTFLATDATGCPGSATAQVNVINTPQSMFTTSSSAYCTGEVGTITYTGNASSSATYTWNFGGATVVSGSGAGPYLLSWSTAGTDSITLMVQDSGCSSLTYVQYVTINQTPSAPTASSNSPVCEGATINLTASNVVGGTYNWTGPLGFNDTNQNPTISGATVPMTGAYFVYATISGCPSSMAVTVVSVIPTPVTTAIATPDSVCDESPFTLYADTLLGGTYSWTGPSSFSSTNQNPTINPADFVNAGTYTVTVSVSTAGCTGTASVDVFVKPLPDSVVASSNSPLCEGSILYLYSDTFALGNETYLWTGPNSFSDNSQNPVDSFTVYTGSGPYTVTRTVDGCTSHAQSINVQIDQFIPAQVVSDYHTCANDTELTAIPPSAGIGTWSLVSGTGIIASPNNAASVLLSIDTGVSVFRWTVVNGTCSDSAFLTVIHDGIDTCGTLEYNELVTANGDGLNDRLIFSGLHKHPNNKLIIFNRWGSEVFSQSPYKNEWQGRTEINSGGDELPEGTYFFVMKIDNETIIRKGFVEVRR
jgi:gliding motility-associated-like protein